MKIIRKILCFLGFHKPYVKPFQVFGDNRLHFVGDFKCKYCPKTIRWWK